MSHATPSNSTPDGAPPALCSGGLVRPARCPMLDGPSIDWRAAEEIYAHYTACFGNGQSLERIAARGGFSWEEVALIVRKSARLKPSEKSSRPNSKDEPRDERG